MVYCIRLRKPIAIVLVPSVGNSSSAGDKERPELARIRDIAKRAGVSTTTVSHVLNHSRPVHPDTEARVRQAISDLQYTPNMLARSLRRRQTNTIGLLVSDIANPHFGETAYAVEKAAYERGYNLVLCNTDESLEKEIRYSEALFAKQVDGLVLAPTPGDHAYLVPWLARGQRVVALNRVTPGVPTPVVMTDDEEAVYTLASLLLADGHRRLGAILGIETVSTTTNRLRGLERAMQAYGLSLSDAWLYPGQSRTSGGYAAAQAFSALATPPTCVIAFNGVMHDGFCLGLADCAAKGLDEVELATTAITPLARLNLHTHYGMAQPVDVMGRTATNLLLDILSGAASWEPCQIVIPNTLVDLGHKGTRRPAEVLTAPANAGR
jgi:LacI family transcriptional regulator